VGLRVFSGGFEGMEEGGEVRDQLLWGFVRVSCEDVRVVAFLPNLADAMAEKYGAPV
jgi:hypothetical protein